MKIAFNPSTVAALTTPPNNKDITFDLRGRNIFARGVKFYGTDTNTWRDIKINNVSIGSYTLDLRNGSNTTLTNTNGVVTINSTWRPVVDNLTSDSTTSSLSAKQGKVLKALIDGKSNSDHNHDGRYLKLSGGTMTSDALIRFADSGSWDADKGPQGARGGLYWSGQSDYAKLYAEETTGDNLDLVIQFGDDYSNGLSIRNKANTQTSYISAVGVITTGTFKGNLDWSYITNKPSSYTPSAHTHAWNSLTHSSTTENQAILTNGKANGWKLQTLNIARWDNAANNAHSHANKSVLDGITSALVNSWNTAYNFVNNITGTILDSFNYSGILDSRYYTESEVNSLLSRKLDRVNLTTGSWNPRNYHLAADYHYNGGDLSISESGGKIYVSVDGYFWQNEGQYRVLDTSDVAELECNLSIHQYLSATDAAWYPLVWGGHAHLNPSNSTGLVYKSQNVLSWQTCSQTLYATNIRTNNINNLAIGGGIYWNPFVESTTDSTDAASITVVKAGVAGGTTLVLSQMNDTNDTIQFKTNTAARLYHNSYPILTTQNTYVNNNKGYINGTEITQVNNADKANYANSAGYAASAGNADTAQYLRSLGNQNCQTGRTQAYGNVYTYNTYVGNTGSPTTYSSIIGFGKGIGGTVEIAGGWCNTNLYWRSLRDCCDDWFPWRTVLDSSNYTEFINNYYWANVKISASSSTTTSPTVSNLTATSSIRMHNISLEHADEINNIINGGIYLNYRNSGDVSLCYGGGNVGIGTTTPSNKLDVHGNIITKGLGIRPYYLSIAAILPTIRLYDGYTYKCLEISETTEISCIIADRAGLMGERGVLIKFNKGYDGQIILLKDLQTYGSGNGYFWVMPSGCKIISADNSSTLVDQNQISNTYDDGRSRFLIYSSMYSVWIEFLCSNTF